MLPEWWTCRFGAIPPLGHRLRQALPDRWLRIHSLPGSKRYAEDAAEPEGLLRRHNEVARELLGEDGPCEVLTALGVLA